MKPLRSLRVLPFLLAALLLGQYALAASSPLKGDVVAATETSTDFDEELSAPGTPCIAAAVVDADTPPLGGNAVRSVPPGDATAATGRDVNATGPPCCRRNAHTAS